MSKLAHSNDATMDKIERDQIAREARGDDEPSGHTPGPWAVVPNDGAYVKRPEIGTLRIEAPFPKEDILAIVVTDIPELQRCAVANARLIAAAPETAAERDQLRVSKAELLAALDDLQACSASIIEGRLGVKNSLLTDYNRARTAALDAIAKAKGE